MLSACNSTLVPAITDRGNGQNRPIPGFPSYVATFSGEIVRVRTFSGKPTWKPLKQFESESRHRYVRPSENGTPVKRYVHKLVALAFLGPVPEGKGTDHIDENNQNNRADNLQYLTPEENRAKYQASGESDRRIAEYLNSERGRENQKRALQWQQKHGWRTKRGDVEESG